MGMAAGQARLLSITSRMSDNELRAQIINNQKMRLATKSSQVSEAYTTALNQSQMMFTNYDADNNSTYQKLTFNALTAYNPYNNQYGISNSSGQILVSEKDAINFQNANGDINTFLGYYGLENTTTYFDNLNEYATETGTIPYYTGAKDDDGNPITIDTGMTAEMLQAYYEGIEGSTEHPGYNTTIAGEQYYNYTAALNNFNTAYNAWSSTIATNMDNELRNLTSSDGKTLFKPSSGTDNSIETAVENATTDDGINNVLNSLLDYIDKYSEYTLATTSTENYINSLKSEIQSAITGEYTYTNDSNVGAGLTLDGDEYNGSLTFGVLGMTSDDDKIVTINKFSEPIYKQDPNSEDGYAHDEFGNKIIEGYGPPRYTVSAYNEDTGSYSEIPSGNVTLEADGTFTVTYTYADDDNQTQTIKYVGIPDVFNGADENVFSITETKHVTVDSKKETAKQIINSLKGSIYQVWNPALEPFINKESPEYKTYTEKAQALEQILFGTTGVLSEESYPNLLDVEWLVKNMTPEQQTNFQPILDVLILDNIMNTYGEPSYAWIDTSEVTDSYNENGSAKAQWYTNLFNRMKDGGYQVLQDGLASSSEWIQFAFENGIITLEQVDSKYAWNTLIYSSCSDITEQTDSAAIAIAEAEYNAAMNKIENKDKMYDLELKNIDTEHNSLETEYESIKSAIDKNIERTFKIYS